MDDNFGKHNFSSFKRDFAWIKFQFNVWYVYKSTDNIYNCTKKNQVCFRLMVETKLLRWIFNYVMRILTVLNFNIYVKDIPIYRSYTQLHKKALFFFWLSTVSTESWISNELYAFKNVLFGIFFRLLNSDLLLKKYGNTRKGFIIYIFEAWFYVLVRFYFKDCKSYAK